MSFGRLRVLCVSRLRITEESELKRGCLKSDVSSPRGNLFSTIESVIVRE